MSFARLISVYPIFVSAVFLAACANSGVGNSGQGGEGAAGHGGGEGGKGGHGGQGNDGGSGGQGAQGGHGGEGAQGGHGGGDGQGGAAVCGNGVIEPGEDCDGAEFGGKSCEALDLGNGVLQCNKLCHIVITGCVPDENCNNGIDDDKDGSPDCADPDCVAELACTDSCAAPTPIPISFGFGSVQGDTIGRAALLSPSCTGESGREQVFALTVDASGTYSVYLDSVEDLSLSVRMTCDQADSEIMCGNNVGALVTEILTLSAVAGTTYFLVVDGVGLSEAGPFTLAVFPAAPPEADCSNYLDDDGNLLVDCEDPSCQMQPACAPGAGAIDTVCTQHTDCAASGNDPFCISSTKYGWPNGYCTEFCPNGDADCPMDSTCIQVSLQTPVCLKDCTDSGDCRAGYFCQATGFGGKVCAHP